MNVTIFMQCFTYRKEGKIMDKETEKKALAALERQKKQYQRQNEYIKGSFERVSVTLPKGTKERIKATGQSVNSFINNVVKKELDKKG